MSRVWQVSQERRLGTSGAVVGFESIQSGAVALRYLTIGGQRAYDLGVACDTCAFLFERLDGANRSVSSAEASDALRSGIENVDEPTVAALSDLVPEGQYRISLSEMGLQLTAPGSPEDYFVGEQVDLWGIDGFWGLPHFPKTEYYRAASVPLGDGKQLFEFVVPMFPSSWLTGETVEKYRDQLRRGGCPTAVALSILDVKQPADWEGTPEITQHWCLAHYLLDGHHKVYAAASEGFPTRLLSFLAIDEGISQGAQIQEMFRTVSAE
jgi:hypothetical protein